MHDIDNKEFGVVGRSGARFHWVGPVQRERSFLDGTLES